MKSQVEQMTIHSDQYVEESSLLNTTEVRGRRRKREIYVGNEKEIS